MAGKYDHLIGKTIKREGYPDYMVAGIDFFVGVTFVHKDNPSTVGLCTVHPNIFISKGLFPSSSTHVREDWRRRRLAQWPKMFHRMIQYCEQGRIPEMGQCSTRLNPNRVCPFR